MIKTAYTRMLLGMLQNRMEARHGSMIDVDRVLEDGVYASAVFALARGTLNTEIRVLATLLWPLVSQQLDARGHALHGCPPYGTRRPRSARILTFPRPAFA